MSPRLRNLADRVLTPATGKAVLSRQVIITSATFSVVLHLFGGVDFGTESIAYRALAAAVSTAPMFLLIALVQRLPLGLGTTRLVAVVSSFFLGGALRGMALAFMLDLIGVSEGGGWRFRIPAGALNMGSVTLIAAFGWATYQAHRQAAAGLLLETRRLQEALAKLEAESEAETLQQITNISATIVRDLQAIELHPAGAQVRQIQRLIDERVRPLSREMAADIQEWVPPNVTPPVPSPRTVWANMDPLKHLPSPWFGLVVALAPFPLASQLFGSTKALDVSAALFATLGVSVFVGNRIARRAFRGYSSPLREILITAMFLLVATIGVASTYLTLRDTAAPDTFVVPGLVTFPVYSWLTLIGLTYWADAREQEWQLRSVRANLTWAIARVNLLTWFNRGVITRLLHGPIQNAMHATVIRLRNSDPEAVVDGVIQELRERILDVDSLVHSSTADAAGFQMQLTNLARLWSGIAAVSIESTDEATAALAGDAAGAAIVLDLCQEVLSNAIRHGAAKNLRIALDADPRRLIMQVQDDGTARVDRVGVGVGTQFLDTCSIAWRHQRVGIQNQLEILIPTPG